ncbi:LamG domain-containing protein [Microbacterium sp. B19]|uniref:LamG domain-containing protein n=1 Tax=Microbacterium sp. B19 TaxID=96765 RepID=UPI00034BEAC9|nr:LamG domain-containing protein [Microbacterium sp. B19]
MRNALPARRCAPLAIGVVGLLAASAAGAPAMAAPPVMRAVAPAVAPAPLASFDFDSAPTDGAFVSGDARANVQGTATLEAGEPGHGTAARLSSAFWLDLKTAGGGALLAGRDNVTISYDSRPDAQGNVGWAVFAASANTPQTYGRERYLGVLDRADGLVVERYLNTAGRDASGNLTAPAGGAWKHVDLVLSGETGRLYVDHELVAANLTGEALSAILGQDGGVLQVGKGNWGGGEYFSGLIDDLRVYDRALTPAELGVTGAPVDDRAALGIPSVVIGDLPDEVRGRAVTWSASGPGAGRIAPDGTVDTAGLDDAGVAARLEARVDGDADPFTWEVTLQRPSGEIAAYVKTVTTTNGVKDDPLAYADDRRSDALYVAARAAGTTAWTPLNRGQAILSVGGTTPRPPNPGRRWAHRASSATPTGTSASWRRRTTRPAASTSGARPTIARSTTSR